MKEIKIEKIVLNIGKQKIELSVEELRQLKIEIDRLIQQNYVMPYMPFKQPSPFITWTSNGTSSNTLTITNETLSPLDR